MWFGSATFAPVMHHPQADSSVTFGVQVGRIGEIIANVKRHRNIGFR